MAKTELEQLIVNAVRAELTKRLCKIPVGVSNRHVHLSRRDMDILFGEGSELTHQKDLGQPGQFAAREVVTLEGPKGKIQKVRVLGPLRKETQVEISVTDGFALGVRPEIRESGDLADTPGLRVTGPRGSIPLERGVIAAQRHIHMPPETAREMGLKDKDIVSVELGNRQRSCTLNNVLVRVSEQYALELHVDVDEANATGAGNGDTALISG